MNFDQLITSLRDLDGSLKGHVARTANVGLTLRNWLVGAYIVEFEQNGEERSEYGDRLMPTLAKKLGVPGLNLSNLKSSKAFALAYPQKGQTLSGLFQSALPQALAQKSQTLSGEFQKKLISSNLQIPQSASAEFKRPDFALDLGTLIQKLTFSHFVELLRLDDPLKRGWSVCELKRQIGSLLFERLGLSTDKEKLLRLTAEEVTSAQPADVIKDPYIFEFLGLTPKEAFRESDLETALIDHLQDFLLELGNGFCFEDRQKKIRIGQSDYFVDLVFYHRKLHCHVLIELKVEPFNHANAGQLNTYLNYYRKHEMAEGDNPPVGLLLCTDKDHALVEYALGGMDENLFVSAYKVALPKPEELEAFLLRESKNLPES